MADKQIHIPGNDQAEITFGWTCSKRRNLQPSATIAAVMMTSEGRIPSADCAAFNGQPQTACESIRRYHPMEMVSALPRIHMSAAEDDIHSNSFRLKLDQVPSRIVKIAFMLHIIDARNSAFSTLDIENVTVMTPAGVFRLGAGSKETLSRWVAVLLRDPTSPSGWSVSPCEDLMAEEGLDVIDGLLDEAELAS